MPNGKNPLMLMMALAMPGATQALGLGDIHVDSALNERLAAEIDIVGATADELADLRAAVANRETFMRYGSDRPAFLSSATFKVAQDNKGRPVLAVRSTEPFTEPLVNFLVDLHWRKGELVRQYTLLLDPPGFGAQNRLAEEIPAAAAASAPSAPAAPDVPAAPAAATPILERKIQTVARQVDPPSDRPNASSERAARKMARIKVGAKATLRGIAWRIGERSASDLQRMMIALFRANPSAFDGNINRLHLGAVLNIPTNAELEAISREEAKREFHVHMAAWRSPVQMHASTSRTTSVPVAAAAAVAPPAPALQGVNAGTRAASAKAPETDELNRRVQLLEHELVEVHGLLESQQTKLINMRQQVALAEKMPPVGGISVATALSAAVPSAAASSTAVPSALVPGAAALSAPVPSAAASSTTVPSAAVPSATAVSAASPLPAPKSARASLVAIVGGLGLLSGAFAAFYFRLRRRAPMPKKLPIDSGAAPADVRNGAGADSQMDAAKNVDFDLQENAAPAVDPDDVFALTVPTRVNHTAANSRPDLEDTIVDSPGETVKLPIDPAQFTRVEATRLDYNLMDLDMTAQYVHLPSALNEQAVFKERRTNLADVLKLAIEREPDRHDLRMKLLELYYSAAATNRQAFLEVVQMYARDRNCLDTDQWNKIAFAPPSSKILFSEPSEADDDIWPPPLSFSGGQDFGGPPPP